MQALFIGAGASYECGLPLTVELSTELRLWLTRERLTAYNTVWTEQGRGWDEQVADRLAALLDDRELSYEQLLAAMQVHQLAEQDGTLRQGWYAAQLFILQAVYGLLLERQIKNYHYAKVAMRDFKGIKAMAERNRPLWVFTANQDCMLELLAAELFIPLKSGFDNSQELLIKGEKQAEKYIEFERLTADAIAQEQYNFFEAGEYGINLVKLNGSLDIFAVAGESDATPPSYMKMLSSSKTPDYYLDALLHLNTVNQELALSREGLTNNESLFLGEQGELHQWQKTLLSGVQAEAKPLTIPEQSPFLKVFSQQLEAIDDLFSIGYGFADQRINTSLSNWLSANEERQLRIVDPEVTAAPESLREHSAQITPAGKKAGAGEFFMSMDGDFGSLLQRVQRKMRGKARQKLLEKLVGK